ncbi:hypothetical protein [Herbiconiux daphne]|uniref:Uncharacterized protein n=1 Tax=Herbiconiux daphne TaxID=2970914 RepID=A0ABT2GX17_9MICO|nr:hypothetical protein [Herbiconiux daphne]MCS5732451.1 hypothetical protein [Herbiconiux daphne]
MVNKTAAGIVAGGAVAAIAAVVIRRTAGGGQGSPGHGARWRVVTINLEAADVLPGGILPPPLAELEELIEVRTSPAPGGRGTELAARALPLPDASGDDLPGLIRRALRESKQLLETGELPTNEPQPEGHRPKTPAGLLVDAVTRRSPEEGVL